MKIYIVLLLLSMAFGWTIGYHTSKMDIEVVEVPAMPIIIKQTEIEKIKEPVYLRALSDWVNSDELKSFLKADDTESLKSNDCDDFALQLRDRAEAIGKNIEFVPVTVAEYEEWSGQRIPETINQHALNLARVGNYMWYIDPLTDKCWQAFKLD